MRRRELVLDFTSLLDVIMIILFVVISNMGQSAIDTQKKAQDAIDKNATIKQKLIEENKEKNELADENKELKDKESELKSENNKLKAEAGRAGVDEAELLDRLLNKATKITLICSPYVNANKSNEQAVEISIYCGSGDDEQETADIVTFTHDFNMNIEERKKKNAEMQSVMYESLKKIISTTDTELVLVTIQYTYNDKNFSQMDLEVINSSIEDIERNLSKTCYIDKVKQ
ncbi:MAG: hypothetical protein E7271_03855 [Lachnospiraceae bacterium]|jgi:FtsZ-binding cell division protein ZapB|nr:hypothetical protein [Lachnospiraceae bacterium]